MHRVIVFDDDPTWLREFTTALEEAGHRVFGYGTEAAVLAALRSPDMVPPDCAVLDIQVGTGSGNNAGFRLCDRIRQIWPEVEVFFLTSYAHDRAIKMGASMKRAVFRSKAEPEITQVILNQIKAWVPRQADGEGRRVGSLWINRRTREITWRDKIVLLKGNEREIVRYLSYPPRTTRTYEQIREGACMPRFGPASYEKGGRSERHLTRVLIHTHIHRIRKTLQAVEDRWAQEQNPPVEPVSFHKVIETVGDVGYVWNTH